MKLSTRLSRGIKATPQSRLSLVLLKRWAKKPIFGVPKYHNCFKAGEEKTFTCSRILPVINTEIKMDWTRPLIWDEQYKCVTHDAKPVIHDAITMLPLPSSNSHKGPESFQHIHTFQQKINDHPVTYGPTQHWEIHYEKDWYISVSHRKETNSGGWLGNSPRQCEQFM